MSLLNRLLKKDIYFHLKLSSAIHFLLILFSEIQDRLLDVKYTDIDYVIFTDGARFVLNGSSPFDRETYRYTPFLAWIMTPNITTFAQFGKVLFSAFDILTGWLIHSMLPSSVNRKLFALTWLYNPLTIIISTRGSSESIICTLVILAIYFLTKKKYLLSGLVYGFVIHFKIYPIIYIPSFYLVLSNKNYWSSLLPNKSKFIFFTFTFIGLVVPTLISYLLYGQIYIDEAWLYHFARQDLQHNFSPYFFIYHFATNDFQRKLLAYAAFIPQFIWILHSAFYYLFGSKQKKDLFMSLFVQTVVFVSLNKVITAQYFEWYMCLLPLIAPFLNFSLLTWVKIFIFWSFSILQWLLPAYFLEFRKWDCFYWVGHASISFVIINLAILLYFQSNFSQVQSNFNRNLKTKTN